MFNLRNASNVFRLNAGHFISVLADVTLLPSKHPLSKQAVHLLSL